MVNVTERYSTQACHGCGAQVATKIMTIQVCVGEQYTLPAMCKHCRRSIGIMLQDPDVGLKFQGATK
jgi:hypothetical protein